MNTELPIGALIYARQGTLGISAGELVRRLKYQNASKGNRRLEALCRGDLGATTKFVIDALPAALELPAAEVQAAVRATMDQIEEAQKAWAEAEERAYRQSFRPHVVWATEYSRPTSIVMATFYGIPRLLRFDLDAEKGEETFVAQALAAMPSTIPFFGKAMGFTINYSPDTAVQYDAQGNVVATFSRAQRLPEADVTLKDGRSIVGLIRAASSQA